MEGGAEIVQEKTQVVDHLESIYEDHGFTPEQERKLLRSLDIRLCGTCGLMLCVSLIDRNNLSSAAIAGMLDDLQLRVGVRYSLITLIFFVPYIIFQFPGMVLLRKIGPRPFMAGVTFCYGIIIMSSGFAKTWQQLIALRFLLGISESALYPGCIYLISTWYKRYELQKRYAILYTLGISASAFSGLLAYGFMALKGRANLNGWSWIFIMEGILTCIIATIGYFVVVDFPEKAQNSWRFINTQERDFLISRVVADRGSEHVEAWKLRKFLRPALDLKTWAFGLLNFGTAGISYAIAYFLPIILNEGLGFEAATAQCLTVPPHAASWIYMFVIAWIGDRYHYRAPFVCINVAIMFTGLCLMGLVENTGARYFGTFLVVMGSNCNVPTLLTYQANNISGQWMRAFCSALFVSFGGIGGIAGSLMFRSQDAPNYRPGLYGCMAMLGLTLVVVFSLSVYFFRQNRAQAAGKVIYGIVGFRYTY